MSSDRTSSTALVIGASRGLELGLVHECPRRGWDGVATVRGDSRTGLHEPADSTGGRLTVERLDVTDAAQIRSLR
jgi:NAD(P)-dependent dehydrogenase (short-subunit alcohol dehydrogenase family)